jgi:predicted ATPase/DNA-binding SARP family transcriptional activator
MTTSALLRVHLLGAFRVTVGGHPIAEDAWRSRRAAALVKLLALAPHYRLHREQATEALWPDLDPAAQANNLNVAASRARQVLASAGAPAGIFLVRLGDALVLGPPDAVWVDADAFEADLASAWQGEDPTAFHAALALYTGDLLVDDRYEEWAEARRTTLRAKLLALLARLGHLHVTRNEFGQAIEAYQRLLALEPTHEEASVALIRLYAGQGQRALALTQFQRLAAALRRDLDVAPEPATVELAETIREGRHLVTADPPRPAGTARPVVLGNLPVPLDDLVDRERELAEIRQMLMTGRLVTLTGPGGIRKTRLALAVAHGLRGSFPDGVVVVDLAPIHDPALVPAVIARTLNLPEPNGRSTIDGLVTHLHDKRLLLLLDNFEQVADAAPVLSALLERAPHLRLLVTSRLGLRLTGEREYPVPPLPVPDLELVPTDAAPGDAPAVTLFVHRAQGINPDFRITSDNASAIAAVCRRLDGLPLAIELAAARVKVLTPEAMLTRLDSPLALLVGGRRDLPARQQTIRQTIAWSHDLLSAPEQRLFRRLAVFVGGWTLEAAEAVVDPDRDLGIDVLDGLASLVDRSLVVQHEHAEGVRFGMLETIREFELERLTASGEEERVRDCHAAHFVELAERARPRLEATDQAAWLERLEREEANLRAALDWIRERGDAEPGLRLVTALELYWFTRGRSREGCDQILGVVALPGSARFPARRAEALNCVAFLARGGDEALAYRASVESRSLARSAHDHKGEADALANLGYLAFQQGDLAEAQVLFGECLGINQALDNRQGIADALSFLSLIALERNDLETARRLSEEGLAIWEALGDRQGTIWARNRLARILAGQGEDARAFDALVTSLAVAREIDFPKGISRVLDGLAHLALSRDAYHLATALATAAAAVREEAGLWLPVFEQTELSRLWTRVEAAIGANGIAAAKADNAWQTPDALVQAVERALGR